MEKIKVKNSVVMKGDNPISLKGVNLGSWLNIENFMLGIPAIESQIRNAFLKYFGEETTKAFFKTYAENFITEKDIAFIKQNGFNMVRLPFNYRYFEDDDKPFEYKEEAFGYINELMDWCEKHEIFVLLDFHALQGGQNTTPPADNPKMAPLLWTDKCYQDRAIALWKEMAKRYKNRECLLGYNLFNEPITTQPELMNAFYKKLIVAIREVDSESMLILEACVRQSGGCNTLDESLFEDKNAIPSFHYYPEARVADKYPAEINGKIWTKEVLKESMENERIYSEEVKLPMLMGEFGFNYDGGVPSVMSKVIDDQLSIAESYNWHWCLWSYKDIGVMGLLNPNKNTAWREFVENKEMVDSYNKCREAFHKMFDDNYIPLLGKNEENRLVFDLSFNYAIMGWYLASADYCIRKLKENYSVEEIIEMPKAFHFDNCYVNDFALETLKKHL